MKISQIIDQIEQFAPLALQQSWDNSGVQVGNTDAEVRGVVVALDVTMGALEKAIECGANLIVSHHPLIFEGLKNITNASMEGAIVIKAIENGVTIYSSHTPSDSAHGGLNSHIASLLGLGDVEVLEPSTTDPSLGIGRVGNMAKPIPVGEFCALLQYRFHLPCVRYTAHENEVRRVAICSGSGASLIDLAKSNGADTYICGDLKYHDYQRVNGIMSMFDIGHYESEIFFTDIIANLIDRKILKNSKKCVTFAVYIYRDNFISYYGHQNSKTFDQ